MSIGKLLSKLFKSSAATKKLITPVAKVVQEEPFGGVPLSKFNELANQCYHGISCTVDQWGFLVFHSKSNRGNQTFHTQMTIDGAGKLINLGGHYPGQWKSSADDFAELVNKTLKLKK